MSSLNYLNFIKVDSTCLTRDLFVCSYSHRRDFFRYKEISNIKMNNLSFYDTHVNICIESSKTDIYRQGNTVLLEKQILILVQSSY
jgi:cytidylate kinase